MPRKFTVSPVVTCLVLASLIRIASAQTLTPLFSFNSKDGSLPSGGVIRGADGNFYGTAGEGGFIGGKYGHGVIFKLTPSGKETILYTFTGKSDGAWPKSGLIQDKDGNLFGTASFGGDFGCSPTGLGCGVIFKFNVTTGKLTVLYHFGKLPDAQNPSPMILARDEQGNFYGATDYGGSANSGAIFKLEPSGKETVLYSFLGGSGVPDGSGPNGVILDSAGNLYGTTQNGAPGNYGFGTVFKVDSSGKETILHVFAGEPDGVNPMAGLVRDSSGNLYGTTLIGGTYGSGTVFKVDPNGNETVLWSFSRPNGGYSQAPLILDAAGNLYGTCGLGGAYSSGDVFKLDPSGNLTVLSSFNGTDGYGPLGKLLLYKGSFYGVTQKGGAHDWGAVFKLTP